MSCMSGTLNKYKFKLSLLLTFALLIIIWALIGTIGFNLDEEFITSNFIFDSSYFFNNSGQTLQYISVLIGFTVLFPIIYLFVRKKINIDGKYVNRIFDVFMIFLIVFSVAIGGVNIFSSFGLVVIVILIYYLVSKKYEILNNIVIKKQHTIIIILSVFTSILYIDKSYQQSFFLMHHVTAYYYPIHKILNGLTPYIDFNSLYGGYCYVYAAILKLFPQNLHLIVFSILTSICVFVSLVLTYRFLNSYIKEKKNIIYIYLSFLFCNIYLIYVLENSTYIQYMPHRYLSMIIMMNYVLSLLKNSNLKKILLGYVLCSFMIFWNFDSGFIIAIAYTLFVVYSELCNKNYKNIFLVFFLLILSIVVPFIIIIMITFLRVGYLPNVKNFLFSTILFSNSGFLSLKLKYTSAPWIIVLVGYLIFFGKSIINLFDKKDKKIGIVCFLALLGLGIFIYYIERSVIIKFVFIIVPLLFLMANAESKNIKTLNLIINYLFSFLCIIFVCLSFVFKFLFNNVSDDLKNQNRQLLSFSENIGLENFEMYINCDTIYYELFNKRDMKRLPSYLDLFTKSDLNKLIDYIEDSDKNIVISYDLVLSNFDIFLAKSIKEKYYIYYTYDKTDSDNYFFFIKKSDLKKISNIDEYYKVDKLRLGDNHE